MKKRGFFCIVTLLLITGTTDADLVVKDYLGNGESVVYDTVTGYHWYRNLPYFTNMTYAQQITAIAGLGTFGNISGGWHMATLEDIQSLAANPGQSIVDTFLPTYMVVSPPCTVRWAGRYEDPFVTPFGGHLCHYSADTYAVLVSYPPRPTFLHHHLTWVGRRWIAPLSPTSLLGS